MFLLSKHSRASSEEEDEKLYFTVYLSAAFKVLCYINFAWSLNSIWNLLPLPPWNSTSLCYASPFDLLHGGIHCSLGFVPLIFSPWVFFIHIYLLLAVSETILSVLHIFPYGILITILQYRYYHYHHLSIDEEITWKNGGALPS